MERCELAASKNIGLRDGRTEHHVFYLRVTDTKRNVTCRFLGNVEIHVNLIGRPRNRRRLNRHFTEVIGLVDALLGELHPLVVVPTAFHLADFLADHLVPRFSVASDVDSPHIGTFTGINKQGKGDLALLLIDFRRRVYVGKGITFRRQLVAD